ncbi:hypothetical protein KCP69_01460 [Salmonella enterica subsp. enterica]|nr:hypothetical protein KCP69_01460 [Salmonella enterica subsp. enterica]
MSGAGRKALLNSFCEVRSLQPYGVFTHVISRKSPPIWARRSPRIWGIFRAGFWKPLPAA